MPPKSTPRAQWDDIRDLFLLQHLLRAAHLGKKTDSGFKKDVWTELVKSFTIKFGVIFQVSQFHTPRTSRKLLSLSTNSSSCVKTTRSFRPLSIRVDLDGMM